MKAKSLLVKDVLTAEQWEKFQVLHRRRMERWRRAEPRGRIPKLWPLRDEKGW